MDVINNRRSVREFSEEMITEEEVMQILRAAMQAPSAKNQQPWAFLLVRNKEILKRCAETIKNTWMLNGASLAIVFLTDKMSLKVEAMYPADLASAVTTSLIEATSLGIGSCWCGIYPDEERMALTREIFKLYDERYEPYAIVAYGYPKNKDSLKFIDRFDRQKILNGEK